jgi:hypothetical protein
VFVGFEVLTEVVMKSSPPSLLATCFTLVSFLAYSSTLKVDATCWLTFNGLHGVISQKIELFKKISFY